MRLTICFHRFGPYHHARLRAAGKLGEVIGLELSSRHDATYWDYVEGADGFRRVTLFDNEDVSNVPPKQVLKSVFRSLDSIKPDVVAIPGWVHKGSLSCLLWCLHNGVPAIMMSASHACSKPRVGWREAVKRRIVRHCASGLVGGTLHKNYLASLGIPQDRIFFGYDVVDNHHFVAGADAARQHAEEHRVRLGLKDRFFLASNRFLEKKNLDRLLRAYAKYRSKAGSAAWNLLMLGDGPLMNSVRQVAEELDLLPSVTFAGFKQYDELPIYYALAEVFVHASTYEEWGLVINEALASGIPVIVSDRCGCVHDLVEAGKNGFVFDPYDTDSITQSMLRISADSCDLQRMGVEGRRIIAKWNPDTFAANIFKAAETALAAPSVQRNVVDQMLMRFVMR